MYTLHQARNFALLSTMHGIKRSRDEYDSEDSTCSSATSNTQLSSTGITRTMKRTMKSIDTPEQVQKRTIQKLFSARQEELDYEPGEARCVDCQKTASRLQYDRTRMIQCTSCGNSTCMNCSCVKYTSTGDYDVCYACR